MDNEKSNNEIDGSEQSSSIPVHLIGSWTIEKNAPYGFVIRNMDENSCGIEYHFCYASNGWITVRQKNTYARVLNAFGELDLSPILCDQESTKKYERIRDLKYKGFDLTEAEAKELLQLSGMIKKE